MIPNLYIAKYTWFVFFVAACAATIAAKGNWLTLGALALVIAAAELAMRLTKGPEDVE